MDKRTGVVNVGDGRGFVVANLRVSGSPPLVVTAAHCVPEMLPAHLGRYLEEQTFRLLGPLFGEPSVYASVAFYDPIADVAVLEQPDNQLMSDEADAYEELLAQYAPLAVAVPGAAGRGYLYDLAGKPRQIKYRCWQGSHHDSPLVRVEGYTYEGGMSGSPVVDARGRALCVVSTGSNSARENGNMASPCLVSAIPSRIRLEVRGTRR